MFLDPTCFESEWIRGKRDELRLNDAGRLEVAILAFELLGRLVTAGLEFVFKGGTSVLLHVPSLRRLSVDIDIVTERPFPEVLDLGVAISGPLAVLNGLRGIAPEAFWMWKRTADWLGAGA
jgi:hypothetical protein